MRYQHTFKIIENSLGETGRARYTGIGIKSKINKNKLDANPILNIVFKSIRKFHFISTVLN